MSVQALRPASREVRDFYGRRYRVGESDQELLGRSRKVMLWAAWAAMLAASLGQYGYGALMPVLSSAHGWTREQGFWVLGVWVLCQSVTVYPAAKLRVRLGLPPIATMSAGAVLCATGLVTLGGSGSFAVVLLVHAVLGGLGAGLIYGTSLSVVARWYPERPARTAFVSGAFAYGSVPFILLAGGFSGPHSIGTFLGVTGLVVLAVVGAAATVLKDPPEYWWPAHVDPRRWALDGSINRGLRNNRPAIRRYTPGEMVRCPIFVLLALVATCAAAVAVFDVAYLADFALRSGWTAGFAGAAIAAFAGACGLIRGIAGWAGARFGRRRIVRIALGLGGAAQLLLPVAAERGSAALLLVACCAAGAAAGTWYAVLPGLTEAHFGERPGLPIFGLSYCPKALGGVLGTGLAAYVASSSVPVAGFAVTAMLSLCAAVLVGRLRQPGRPRLPLPGSVAYA
jgi:MFS family permease